MTTKTKMETETETREQVDDEDVVNGSGSGRRVSDGWARGLFFQHAVILGENEFYASNSSDGDRNGDE